MADDGLSTLTGCLYDGMPLQWNAMPVLNVLFVCVENACRSQIAEAFARTLGQGRVRAFSAGSKPRGRVDQTAIDVMREVGIAMDAHASKGLDQLPPVTWDAIVTMGCGDACPSLPAKQRIDWQIPDPARAPTRRMLPPGPPTDPRARPRAAVYSVCQRLDAIRKFGYDATHRRR